MKTTEYSPSKYLVDMSTAATRLVDEARKQSFTYHPMPTPEQIRMIQILVNDIGLAWQHYILSCNVDEEVST